MTETGETESNPSSRKPIALLRCRFLSKSPLATTWALLLFAFAAFLIGLGLFILSAKRSHHHELHTDKRYIPSYNGSTAADYWLSLHDYLRTQYTQAVSPDNSDLMNVRESDLLWVPGSPQWRALEWLVSNDPLAPLPLTPRLVQRYALAVLFFYYSGQQVWVLASPADGWCKHVAVAAASPTHTITVLVSNAEAGANAEKAPKSIQVVKVPIDECDWLGITCNDKGEVIQLELNQSSFVLMGGVPAELGLLSRMTLLDLSSQKLKGSLPPMLYSGLTSLTHLHLRDNGFTAMDEGLALLTNLQSFDYGRNNLEGTLPVAALSKWTNLRSFLVTDNSNLTGNIWQECVQHWPYLENIEVSATQLSGKLPEIAPGSPLFKLKTLYASFSLLTGTLPDGLALATDLVTLSIGELDGRGMTPKQLPTEYGRLTKLQTVSLQNANAVTGTIPTEIGLWTNLEVLNLHYYRNLAGTIPSEMGYLTKLGFLELSYTSLTGTIPTELGQCTKLYEARLHQSKLHGDMPKEVCDIRVQQLAANCVVGAHDEMSTVTCDPICCTECY